MDLNWICLQLVSVCDITSLGWMVGGCQTVDKLFQTQFPICVLIRQLDQSIDAQRPERGTKTIGVHHRRANQRGSEILRSHLSSRFVSGVSEYVRLSAVSLCFRNLRNSLESSCESPLSYICNTFPNWNEPQSLEGSSSSRMNATFHQQNDQKAKNKGFYLMIRLKEAVHHWHVERQLVRSHLLLNPVDHSLSQPIAIRQETHHWDHIRQQQQQHNAVRQYRFISIYFLKQTY